MATGSIITSTSSPSSSSDKLFGISQIKAYVPIVLDMEKLNYDSWRELFETTPSHRFWCARPSRRHHKTH
ncbi:unnamed protein product [Arabidopsis halleri]